LLLSQGMGDSSWLRHLRRKASAGPERTVLRPGRRTRTTWNLTTILLLLFLIALAVDLSVRIWALAHERCEGHVIVPRAFVLQYPQCAQKLIETAHLDNLEIVSPEDYHSHDEHGPENVSVNSPE